MTEYEVKITNIDVEAMRERLKKAGATLAKEMFMMKIATHHLPEGHRTNRSWMRVRDEGGSVTLSLKEWLGDKIEDQKEYQFIADDFEQAVAFLERIGAKQKARQEKRREIWHLGPCEIVIDEWPFLEPLMEVEGPSEDDVYAALDRLGIAREDGVVRSVGNLYREKYGVSEDVVNNETPVIIFDMENPFL